MPDILLADPRPSHALSAGALPATKARLDAPRSGASVLLVESDPLLREIIAAGLALSGHDLHVAESSGPGPALIALDETEVDLILTELAFGLDPSPQHYLERLRLAAPRVPILALTSSTDAARLHGRVRFDAMLAKPPDMDELLRAVASLLDRTRESVMRGLALESVLQVLQLERRTCTVTVSMRSRRGRIWLRQGRIVDAATEGQRAKAAVFLMLTWILPSLTVVDGCDAAGVIDAGVQETLLEHFIHQDHRQRG